jgi:hypothetical protein
VAVVAAGNEDDDAFVDAEDVMDYLVDTVAANHPNATVGFKDVAVQVSLVRSNDCYDAERGEQQVLSALRGFVATTMRDRGNHRVYTVSIPQLETVVADDNQEMITFVVPSMKNSVTTGRTKLCESASWKCSDEQ